MEKVLGEELGQFVTTNHDFVYYCNTCKCRNHYNFGDFVTPFIYECLFSKKPILDINGGKERKKSEDETNK